MIGGKRLQVKVLFFNRALDAVAAAEFNVNWG